MDEQGDWRLMAQERFLQGRELRLTAWFSSRPGWDHDHCEFCAAKIWDRPAGENEYRRGYVTDDDNYHWVCEPCFADFRERFAWRVVGARAEPPN
jgi:hypothetical protein